MMLQPSRLAIVLAAFALTACAVEPLEETETAESAAYLERSVGEMEARAIFRWYVNQGIDPCDPPPDPWHPFVTYGLCDCEAE